ncbi:MULTISPECIES: acyl-CoA carboxylase epsilon subunit [unclassified Streptomyces]|uniref:acyl-CoA carboxylase epsilon subunit n=1 Tax=unclassified Streptomyces TaxID=2593676 RepID=UPI001661F6B5|nr:MULTISPECIES: acyl-CoA carboxylase epsilon subunit [unclassified Streptomyces]MBD0838255.1 acyl-CoA carboxylase subunit epsilon [Streptomyces sp. TRM68416]
MKVVRGEPTAEELSALLTVLLALAGSRTTATVEPLPVAPPAVAWTQQGGGGTSWAAPGHPYWAVAS